jgi:hypothetical protein
MEGRLIAMSYEELVQVKDVLLRLREKLSDESKWCVGDYGMDENFHSVTSFGDSRACRWCLVGALRSVVYDIIKPPTEPDNAFVHLFTHPLYERTWSYMKGLLPKAGMMLEEFNDGATHKEVVEFLDKAISKVGYDMELHPVDEGVN